MEDASMEDLRDPDATRARLGLLAEPLLVEGGGEAGGAAPFLPFVGYAAASPYGPGPLPTIDAARQNAGILSLVLLPQTQPHLVTIVESIRDFLTPLLNAEVFSEVFDMVLSPPEAKAFVQPELRNDYIREWALTLLFIALTIHVRMSHISLHELLVTSLLPKEHEATNCLVRSGGARADGADPLRCCCACCCGTRPQRPRWPTETRSPSPCRAFVCGASQASASCVPDQ